LKTIGITGGIGSGKSTVCRLFETLGVAIFYADDQAKLILYKDRKVKSSIKSILGNDSFYQNGKPNRPYISSKIFTDKLLLNQMNDIVHPAVQLAFEQWLAKQKTSNEAHYVIKEAALLVENGMS
jgi:dephospho-CoA kinase